MIKQLKIENKWQSELKRQDAVEKWLDYYYNNQVDHTLDRMCKTHPKTVGSLSADEKVMFKARIETVNLTETIANKQAILFQNDPEITIEGAKNIQEKFTGMLVKSDFFSQLTTLNKLEKVVYQPCAMPYWSDKDKCVKVRIITPDKVFVLQDEKEPTQAKEIYYQIGVMTDSPQFADNTIKYAKWTDEYYIEGCLGSDGAFTETSVRLDNIYKEIPLVFFQTENTIDTFWTERENYVVQKNEILNEKYTDHNHAIRLLSYPREVRIDVDPKDVIEPTGAEGIIYLPSEAISGGQQTKPDLKFVSPDYDIKEIDEHLENQGVAVAVSSNISSDSFQNKNNFTSGYELKLSKIDIINAARSDRNAYRRATLKLIDLMMICYSAYANDGDFGTNAEVNMDFGEITFETSPQEQANIDSIKLANGTMSEFDIIRRDNPDIDTPEKLGAYLETRKKFQEVYDSFNVPVIPEEEIEVID